MVYRVRIAAGAERDLALIHECFLFELGADGDSFFGGAVKEVFAVEGNRVLAPGFAQGTEVVDAEDRLLVEDFCSCVDEDRQSQIFDFAC